MCLHPVHNAHVVDRRNHVLSGCGVAAGHLVVVAAVTVVAKAVPAA